MPEAFSSIADMRVVIDSSTDRLEAGLTAAQNLVKRFADEGNQSLSLMDRAMGSSSGTVEALAGKLSGVLGKLNEFKGFYDAIVAGANAVGGAVASQTGTEDDFEKVQKSAEDLQDALIGGLGIAFDNVKDSALVTAASLLGFDASAAQANVTAHSAASGGFVLLKQALDNVKFAYEAAFFDDSHQSEDVLETRISLYNGLLADLQSRLSSLNLMNILDNGADQASVDALKQEIAAMQTQIFVLSQMAGGEKILADAKADRTVEGSKAIQALKAETDAIELNVATMKMSSTERQIYNANKKAEDALDDDDDLDDDAKDRVRQKYIDQMTAAGEKLDAYAASKKKDADAKQFLDQMVQETDALRDRVAVLGMASVAAAAYTAQARNARALDKLGPLNSDQEAMADTQSSLQLQLQLQLMADADQRQRQQTASHNDNTIDQAIQGIQRQTEQIKARTSALYDSSEAGRADAIAQQQIANLQAKGIELSPQRIAQIKEEAQAQAQATTAQVEAQQQMKLLGDIGNAVTSNLDNAFRKWASGSQVTVKEMAASILQDLAEIEFKAAVLNPLANFLTGSQTGGSGLLGSLLSLGSSGAMPTAASWSAGTSVIPAFADGGDFNAGPMIVGERGPEMIWPTFPGKVIPNNALPNGSLSGPVTVHVVNQIDAHGAYPESIDDIKRALADTQASIPQISLQAYQQAKDRGVV